MRGGEGTLMLAGGCAAGTGTGGVALLRSSTYGGGGFSTLMDDAWASMRERPGEGDDGADEFGGDGKGERDRFWGMELCEDDAACRCPFD